MDTTTESQIVVTVTHWRGTFTVMFDMLDLPIAMSYAAHWQRTYGYGSVVMEGI